jgi:predicted MFS family arabinose efflux permease
VTAAQSVAATPWRGRDFRIAWLAGLVNDTGDWVLAVGLPVFVFVETGSGSQTAMLFVCQLIAGALLGPIGGSLVDRWNLRRTIIATNLAQAVTLLPLLAVSRDRVWPAFVVIAAQAALTQLNNPANVALVPRVVQPDQLTRANATLAGSASLARLVGAPLGGVLVAWHGLAPIVIVDVLSFVAIAGTVAFITSDTSPVAPSDGAGGGGVRAGVRAVRAHPPLTRVLVLHGCTQVAQGAFVVLFVVFLVDVLGDDGPGIGLIRGTMAVGALLGSAAIARVAGAVEPTALYAAGLVGMGSVSLLFWNAPAVTSALWVYAVLFSLSGIPGAAMSVGLYTTVQLRSPRHTLGRVVGLLGTADAIGVACGSIVTGLLVDRIALRALLDAQAAIYVVTGILACLLVVPRRSRLAVSDTPRQIPISSMDTD